MRYLLVGGYAVNAYGYHRYTRDLDIWVAIDPDNCQKVSEVLQRFGGFSKSAVRPSMLAQRAKVFAFGRAPVRIDLLTSPDGVDFEACWSRRKSVVFDGVPVHVIALADLRANKKASGRAKDLADVEGLAASARKRRTRGA